ncbi:MAG TPA: hypothetical protein VHS96_00545, partial [Bacteroidia bacterium]|nr:hypothetical protein [Bacteroidia bacterium]
GRSAQPPAFQLKAEPEEKSPAQLQEAQPEAEKDTQQLETTAKEAEKETSEGDKLRDAVAAKAEEWNGKEFMTKEEIEDTRVKTGLKNFTTCLEFAGKMMRDGDKEVYGKDWKKAVATTQMFSQTKADWEAAVGQRITADGWGKSVQLFDKAIVRVEGQKAKVVAEIEKLRLPQAEGENDLVYKQRGIRANALEKATVRALDGVLRTLNSQRASFVAKQEKAAAKAESLDANNTAMIKGEDGMTNGRPKPGEFIILAQAPGGSKYGVSDATKVFLHGGSFKHIAVFMSVEKQDDGSGFEVWRTIDGGGTHGKETLLRVRLADRMIFPGQPGAKLPDAGSASGSQVAGWMDMDEIVRKRDEKMAQPKKW